MIVYANALFIKTRKNEKFKILPLLLKRIHFYTQNKELTQI